MNPFFASIYGFQDEGMEKVASADGQPVNTLADLAKGIVMEAMPQEADLQKVAAAEAKIFDALVEMDFAGRDIAHSEFEDLEKRASEGDAQPILHFFGEAESAAVEPELIPLENVTAAQMLELLNSGEYEIVKTANASLPSDLAHKAVDKITEGANAFIEDAKQLYGNRIARAYVAKLALGTTAAAGYAAGKYVGRRKAENEASLDKTAGIIKDITEYADSNLATKETIRERLRAAGDGALIGGAVTGAVATPVAYALGKRKGKRMAAEAS